MIVFPTQVFDASRFSSEGPGRRQVLPIENCPSIRLVKGRLIGPEACARREVAYASFSAWLQEERGVDLGELMSLGAREVDSVLVSFGQEK